MSVRTLVLGSVVALVGMQGASAFGAYREVVLGDLPVSYYRFGELSYFTAASEVNSPANDGLYLGNPSLGQASLSGLGGDPKYSVGFDGVNDRVETPQVLGGSFSIEFWMKTSVNSIADTNTVTAVRGNGLVWSDVGGNADDFTVGLLNNQVQFFTGDTNTNVTGSTNVVDGEWHHVVVTRQISVASKVYVDGVEVGSGVSGTGILNANPNIEIGGNTLDGRYFNGYLDEVAFYPKALSAEQVSAHYFAAVPEASAMGLLVPAAMVMRRRR